MTGSRRRSDKKETGKGWKGKWRATRRRRRIAKWLWQFEDGTPSEL